MVVNTEPLLGLRCLYAKIQADVALHQESQLGEQSTCCISGAVVPLSQVPLCSEYPCRLYVVALG